jgi:AcrR family transcriptional regulator
MATRKAPVLARQGYHHGNLKEALVTAARALIAERGPAGFALSEAARLAGVSAAAPYRHFKDRDALIAEVARRGFGEFARRLAAAWAGLEGEPMTGFAKMGEAYLAFAREEPGYYGAMFTSGGARAPAARGSSTFGELEDVIARIVGGQGQRGQPAGADPRALAYQVWAMSHGIATLSAAGHIPREEARVRPEALLRTGVAALLAGSAAARASSSKRNR